MTGNEDPRLELTASRLFTSWLAAQGASLAFTTYQTGKLFFIGLDAQGRMSVFNRTLTRVMGLAAQGDTRWVATLWQLWRFENALAAGEHKGHFDRWCVPQLADTTGDIDVHDLPWTPMAIRCSSRCCSRASHGPSRA